MMRQVAGLIQDARSVLVVAHQDPDGDALGSTLGLAHLLRALGKEVHVYSAGPLPEEYLFLPGMAWLAPLPPAAAVDLAVLLDCHQTGRTGPESGPYLDAVARGAVVDHHRGQSEYGQAAWLDTSYAATAGMLIDLAREAGWPLTPEAATCLFTGLQTDTGSFRYSNTTPRTFRQAAELVEAGADVWGISQEVYATRPRRIHLLSRMLESMSLHQDGRLALARVSLADLAACQCQAQDLEQVVETLRTIPGVEVAALLRELPGQRVKISLRSRGRQDVSGLALKLGGGGHRNAAGAKVDGSLDQVATRLLTPLAALVGTAA
ncbi:MAG: bifunctional oligoribonuclease/PAP phosphatase NrnA [Deltaproteobacteria bacterium]|nr:bifunctional oligoribonuclease/PAP phosphatase NrnA [Deltaproteobacteria bacterium]